MPPLEAMRTLCHSRVLWLQTSPTYRRAIEDALSLVRTCLHMRLCHREEPWPVGKMQDMKDRYQHTFPEPRIHTCSHPFPLPSSSLFLQPNLQGLLGTFQQQKPSSKFITMSDTCTCTCLSLDVPIVGVFLFLFFALPILAFNAKRVGSAVIPITGGILLGLLIFFVFPFPYAPFSYQER
ncbi:hypothetical protein B0T13DRAFT_474178 [Neurospora crassa]|nr:hypothetical protein B0T13DRAFT_474178 [Neurospora crassa]